MRAKTPLDTESAEALRLLRAIAKNTALILKAILEETASKQAEREEDKEAKEEADRYVDRRADEIETGRYMQEREEMRGYDWPENPKS